MIVTLTGPTCAGKSTVEAALQRHQNFGRAISHTTRLPRANEVDGYSYHFVTDDQYDRLDNSGQFIETVRFGSARYAMSADALVKAQSEGNVVIVVEPHGCSQIHQFCAENKLPSFAVWVDCDPKVQAQRWIKRLVNDAYAAKDVVGPYSDRLHLMLTEEASWRMMKKATMSVYPTKLPGKEYDLSLDSTDSPAELLASIIMGRITA